MDGSAAYVIMRYMSVCLSVCLCVFVTFANLVIMKKHIYNFFFTSGSQAILVFPYQTAWQYSDGNPLTGASNAGGVGRNCDSERAVNAATEPGVINTAPPDHGPASCDTYRW